MFQRLLDAIDAYIVRRLAQLRLEAIVQNGLSPAAEQAIDEVIAAAEAENT